MSRGRKQYPNPVQAFTVKNNKRNATPGPITKSGPDSGFDTISMVITNATGAKASYMVGDGLGIYADGSSVTFLNPTSGDLTPAVLKAAFATRPCAIKEIMYQATVSDAQFANKHEFVNGKLNGTGNEAKWNTKIAQTSADYDKKIRNFVFEEGSQPILSGTQGIRIDVNDGETVYLELGVSYSRRG